MDDGPFRSSGAAACPRCATPMVADPDGALGCTTGCGTWFPASVVAELFGRVFYDARPPSAWWKQARVDPAKCPDCRIGLTVMTIEGGALLFCQTHGMWLDADIRGQLEREYRDELADHRAVLELHDKLVSRDDAGLLDVARRLIALERRIEQLERRLPS